MMNEALELLGRGWSVFPVSLDTKRPLIKWGDYQERLPTEEEIEEWWGKWPDARIGLITGAISGVVVVDCDNEAALAAARKAGLWSPVRVRTKRGCHLYYAHPRDGQRYANKVGGYTRDPSWPKADGLDFRGDGGFVLAPPSKNYEWDIDATFDIDDAPTWHDPDPVHPLPLTAEDFDFARLDLSGIEAFSGFFSVWDETADFVRTKFPSTLKIPTGMGNGRNHRMMMWASECVRDGLFGAELRARCHAFENEFFAEPLREAEFEATVKSMEDAERRNHPERFDEKGEHIGRPLEEELVYKPPRLITVKDAGALIKSADSTQHLIEPWLTKGTIVQVYGYSGHGKSLFTQHMLYAMAARTGPVGPFDVKRRGRVLYIDLENGRGTIGTRLLDLKSMYGDAEDRFMIWSPFLEGKDMDLRQRESMLVLKDLVDLAKPDVIVIDTIRTAYPGMKENAAEEWAKVNQLALRLRNSGYAVILIHHSGKPGEHGMRESGSTNQLTVLETQINIRKVFEKEEEAKANAGIFAENCSRNPYAELRGRLAEMPDGEDWLLQEVMQVSYQKVREWSDLHERDQHIGFASNHKKDARRMVGSSSPREKAIIMSGRGMDVRTIAEGLRRPVRVVDEWLLRKKSS